jgi:hypothetical protein
MGQGPEGVAMKITGSMTLGELQVELAKHGVTFTTLRWDPRGMYQAGFHAEHEVFTGGGESLAHAFDMCLQQKVASDGDRLRREFDLSDDVS